MYHFEFASSDFNTNRKIILKQRKNKLILCISMKKFSFESEFNNWIDADERVDNLFRKRAFVYIIIVDNYSNAENNSLYFLKKNVFALLHP